MNIPELNQMLRLDEKTGKVYWKSPSKYHSEKTGQEAGSFRKNSGRIYIKINGIALPRARVVYALYNGNWPEGVVDHINRKRSDDRPQNLRDVSIAFNNHNHSRVNIRQLPSGKYQVRIGQKSLGTYLYKSEAIDNYRKARELLWGT